MQFIHMCGNLIRRFCYSRLPSKHLLSKHSFKFTLLHVIKYNGIPRWPVSQQEAIWYDNVLIKTIYIYINSSFLHFRLSFLLFCLLTCASPDSPLISPQRTKRSVRDTESHTLPSLLYSFYMYPYKFFSSMWSFPIWT